MTRLPAVALGAVAALVASVGPAAAGGKWSVARSPHFVVVGETGEGPVRATARQLEQFRLLVRSALKLRADPTRPVVVFVVRGERGVKEMLPARRPSTPGAFFLKGGSVHYIVVREELAGQDGFGTVYHEYVHLLNDLNFGRLPLWLNEGLAEFYATTEIQDEKVSFARISPSHLAVLKNGATLPLARLFAIDHGSPEYTGGGHGQGIVYAQSAALTHYLMMDDRGKHRPQLAEFLNQLARGATEDQAAQRAFGSIDALDKAFESYLRRFQFYGVRGTGSFDAREIAAGPLSEAEALAFRAEYDLRVGRLEAASALVERSLAADPRSGIVQRAAGLVRARQGRIEEARAALRRATELAPDDLLSHYYLGTTHAGPETEEARGLRERALLRAIALQPAHAPSLAALSELVAAAGRKEEAVAHAAAARRAEPREVGWGLRLASALRAAERASEAESLEGALIAAAQSDPSVLYEALAYFEQSERKADGAALLTRVQAGNPRGPALQRALGDLLLQAGRFDEAEKAYRAVLAQIRDDASALNSLGYMNADRGVRVQEALALIESALKQSPDSPDYLDSRGWALFRLGRLPEAEKDLRRSVAKDAGAEVLDHLAQVLAARGARDEAAATWRQALADAEIEDDLKAAIERRLAPPSPAP
jgi:tetratricopeptide (TPR) repeat protein